VAFVIVVVSIVQLEIIEIRVYVAMAQQMDVQHAELTRALLISTTRVRHALELLEATRKLAQVALWVSSYVGVFAQLLPLILLIVAAVGNYVVVLKLVVVAVALVVLEVKSVVTTCVWTRIQIRRIVEDAINCAS